MVLLFRVMGAAMRAFLAWFFLYVVVVQILVVLKWDSVHHEIVENVIVEVPKEVIIQEEEPPPPPPPSIQHYNDQESQKRTALLMEEMQAVQTRQIQVIKEIDRQWALIQHNIQSKPQQQQQQQLLQQRRQQQQQQPAKTRYLSPLLRARSLSQASSQMLQEWFQKSLAELEEMAATNTTLRWHDVHKILDIRYERSDPTTYECPKASSQITIHHDMARQSDLEEMVRTLEHTLKKRHSGNPRTTLPKLLASRPRIQSTIQQESMLMMQQQQQQQQQKSARVVQKEVNCVMHVGQVVEMLEEGLRALRKKGNLQTVLTRYVTEKMDRREGERLILDAYLSPPARPFAPPPATTSLRRLLDAPLLAHVGHALDRFVDVTSGYNDVLDQAMDRFVAGNVGQQLVTKMLDAIGHIQIPNTHIPTRAGILKQDA